MRRTDRHAIIYTDGSYRPNHEGAGIGFWGSGAHGYVYSTDPDVKTISDKPTKFVITDKGYIRNEEINKYKNKATEVKPIFYIDACYSFLNTGTVNTGELSAVIELLKDIETHDDELELSSITIKSDSMYVVQESNKMLDNLGGYVVDKDKPNAEFLKDLYNTIEHLSSNAGPGIIINIEKVKGHSDDPGNDIADLLAVYSRLQSSNRNVFRLFNIYTIESNKKYWNFSIPRHPMLEYRQLFFTNSLRGTNDDIFYSILDYKTDKEPGVKTHDACFGLIKLKDKQDIVEDTIKSYHIACNNMNVISTLDLNLLFSRLNSYYYNLLGSSMYKYINKTFSLNTLNQSPIVFAIRPPGLAMQALEKTQYLHYLMSEFKSGNSNLLRKYIDITEMVYSIKEDKHGKKKFTTKIDNTLDHIEVDVDGVKVFVMLGKDTLSRNQFKHLEKDEPKVYLITETKSPDMMNYYTLIETHKGDIGVFCNFYSGKVLLNK